MSDGLEDLLERGRLRARCARPVELPLREPRKCQGALLLVEHFGSGGIRGVEEAKEDTNCDGDDALVQDCDAFVSSRVVAKSQELTDEAPSVEWSNFLQGNETCGK